MKLATVFTLLTLTITGAVAQCSGNSKANGPCTGAGSCGDPALGLCGSAGFSCENGVCKKNSGVYCAMDSGECHSGSSCVPGNPTVGNNYGPAHCS
ncbi:hypothetical protein L218DRAFT_1080875 [Marasmius fiardii PR-910]|nr:hypothetical protein L218DRAFT_1080874 [Marasmius fiardii PR-910]KAF9257531.1 hypothetical protein L218DRAFT_1080875 [Marasmius fiardii PR-910]